MVGSAKATGGKYSENIACIIRIIHAVRIILNVELDCDTHFHIYLKVG